MPEHQNAKLDSTLVQLELYRAHTLHARLLYSSVHEFIIANFHRAETTDLYYVKFRIRIRQLHR